MQTCIFGHMAGMVDSKVYWLVLAFVFPLVFACGPGNSVPKKEAKLDITVYSSPTCGCCTNWLKHLEQNGFQVKDIKTEEINAIKQKFGVPKDMASCHTGIIDGYVVEGHVPAKDIRELLAKKPDVIGISVPQMPVGTPGMEIDDRKDPFSVFAFHKNGETKVFKHYEAY